MRIKAAVVNAGGLMAGGFLSGKVGETLVAKGIVSSAFGVASVYLGLGIVSSMLLKRGIGAELAHGCLVGGISTAAATGIGMLRGGAS